MAPAAKPKSAGRNFSAWLPRKKTGMAPRPVASAVPIPAARRTTTSIAGKAIASRPLVEGRRSALKIRNRQIQMRPILATRGWRWRIGAKAVTRKRSRSPVAARLVTACALASIAVGLIPSGAALAAPARRSRLVAAFDGRGSAALAGGTARARPPGAEARPAGLPGARGLEHLGARVRAARAPGEARSRGSSARPACAGRSSTASLVLRLRRLGSSSLAGTPFGPLVAPDLDAPVAPTDRRKSRPPPPMPLAAAAARGQPLHHAGHARARRRPRAARRAAPAGSTPARPNDPLFCNETNGPYYAEEWNNFCFVPQTQLASVTAGAPRAPRSSGTCNTGAWNLGAQGQGTVIAILDSGVNYYHQDLQNQMVNTEQRPAAQRSQLPGRHPRLELLRRQRRPDGLLRPRHRAARGWPRPRPTTASGMAGASPKSLLMAVKVGDTYVVHSENLAQGVVYAADHGADVINTSLGATGNSKLLRAAATYAYSKGVFWAAATANEYSTHHNYPTNLDTVAGAGGLGPELADPTIQTCQSVGSAGATNCAPGQPADHLPAEGQLRQLRRASRPSPRRSTRSGRTSPTRPTASTSRAPRPPRRTLPRRARSCAAPASAPGCAEGTPTSAARSPRSAATRRPPRRRSAPTRCASCSPTRPRASTTTTPPSGDQQLPAQPERRPDRRRAASTTRSRAATRNRGWNIWSGFGRPDIYAAAAYAEQGLIPPEAQLFGDQPPPGPAFAGLKGPVPFAVYDPAKTPTLTIVGHVAAPRLKSGADVRLEGAGRSLPGAGRGRLHRRPGRIGHHRAGRRARDLDPADQHGRHLHAPVERRPAPVLVPRHLHGPRAEHGRQDRRRRLPQPDLDRLRPDRHRPGPEQGAAADGAALRPGPPGRLRPPAHDGRPRRQPVLPRRVRRGLSDPVRPRGPRRAGRDRGHVRRPGARAAARRHAACPAGPSARTRCRRRTTSRSTARLRPARSSARSRSATSTATSSPRWWPPASRAACTPGTATARRVAGFPVQVPPVSQYADPAAALAPGQPEPAVRRPVHEHAPGDLRPALQRLRVDRRAGAREPREAHRRQARHRAGRRQPVHLRDRARTAACSATSIRTTRPRTPTRARPRSPTRPRWATSTTTGTSTSWSAPRRSRAAPATPRAGSTRSTGSRLRRRARPRRCPGGRCRCPRWPRPACPRWRPA